MKNKIDFRFLRRPLIYFSIAIVTFVALTLFGMEYEGAKTDEYKKAKSSLSASHSKYVKLVEDLDRLELYTEKYSQYRESGLVGSERRLSWIETLEAVNEVLKLPRLTYALLPQQQFARPKLKVDRKVTLSSTPMDLEIDVLHEEDIFAVFEGIQGNIDNLFTIDSCKLRLKKSVGSSFSTKGANMTANCVLRWVTVDAKDI